MCALPPPAAPACHRGVHIETSIRQTARPGRGGSSLRHHVVVPLVALLAAAGALAPVAADGLVPRGEPPTADFTFAPDSPRAGEPVRFASLASDPDGLIVLMQWRFSDDPRLVPEMGAGVTHVFDRPGTYLVTHTVVDSTGQQASRTRGVTVANTPPTAAMHIAPNPATRDADVEFTDISTDPDDDALVAWRWDFGDGSPPATTRNASHRYATTGLFTVTLVVQDAAGGTATAATQLRVVNAAPTITNASAAPQPAAPGETVFFNATGEDRDSQAPLTFEWRFQDGVVLHGASVARSFTAAGRYAVSVTAADAEGARSKPLLFVVEVRAP